jgi:hypothetical protein
MPDELFGHSGVVYQYETGANQKLGEFGVTRLRLWTSPIPRVCILNYKKSVYASVNFGRG